MLFLFTTRQQPRSTLFPYTTLFRSQDREYVTKDQGKFRPTELGAVVTEMLVKHFEDIFDLQYTARMEEELDRKSTRLNSSHANNSYAVFCLKKKKRSKRPR